jgi:hypothetical protein
MVKSSTKMLTKGTCREFNYGEGKAISLLEKPTFQSFPLLFSPNGQSVHPGHLPPLAAVAVALIRNLQGLLSPPLPISGAAVSEVRANMLPRPPPAALLL